MTKYKVTVDGFIESDEKVSDIMSHLEFFLYKEGYNCRVEVKRVDE